jgi:hypothetical protein
MKVFYYALGAIGYRLIQKFFEHTERGFVWQVNAQVGMQPIAEEEAPQTPHQQAVSRMMDHASQQAMRYAENQNEQLCKLCGEAITYEPNAPRHQLMLRILSNDQGFEPFGMICFVHVRCARHLVSGFTVRDESVFQMMPPD